MEMKCKIFFLRLMDIIVKHLSIIFISIYGHLSMAGENVQDIELYPTGDINETATPKISWKCTGDDYEKLVLSENSTGHTIMDTEWGSIIKANLGRCTSNYWHTVGKKIVPPLKPWPPCNGKPGCINVATSSNGGLPTGKYTLTVSLKSKEGSVQSYTSNFAIVENIYSDFSNDAAGWEAIRGVGNWTALAGEYNVRGNSRGEEWVSIYTGDVFLGRKGSSKFYDGRHYQAILSPNCRNERCYTGIVLYNMIMNTPDGFVRYARSEVIISGDQKLSIRYVREDEPGRYWAVLDRKDISNLISDKASYTLDVYVAGPYKGRVIRVYIDKNLVYCGSNNNAIDGNAGIVFSSNEEFESFSVDEFIVRPNPIDNLYCYWDLPYVPENK